MSHRSRVRQVALALVVFGAGATSAWSAERARPLRALVFSGKNNHDWKRTTPVLKQILEASGRFAVDVTDKPADCDARTLAKYSVVVSNWTNWPDVKQREWGPVAEKALLDHVRGGKGFALFHAASTPFQDWADYQQIVGSTWGLGQTGHGAIHAFKVTIKDKGHPITHGMRDIWIRDELWHRTKRQPGIHVLCEAFSARERGGSGAVEPVALCTRFGKGRCFHLVLGHDVAAMRNVAWGTLMSRGTEWAATGKVTIPIPSAWPGSVDEAELAGGDLDADLKAIAKYRFGQSRVGLARIETWVRHAATRASLRKALAAKMSAMLGSDATPDCKQFLCGQLSLIGSAAEVPILAGLLGDKELSLAARSALERIPDEAAPAALRKAMAGAQGPSLIGLVNTLGERRDASSVAVIARHLGSKDPAVAGAAIEALGKIGGSAAAKALSGVEAALPERLGPIRDDALLRCAEGLAGSGRTDEAEKIYRALSARDRLARVRAAALVGLVTCKKDKGQEVLLAALTRRDRALQSAAVRCIPTVPGSALTKALADKLPTLSPVVQVQVVVALGRRADKVALPAVAKAVETDHREVRRAALTALGQLGDASTIPLLAGLAAKSSGSEQRIIRHSLAQLRGEGLDAAMVDLIARSTPPVQIELITALSARNARSAVPALLRSAEAADPKVRAEAIKALGVLGNTQACSALIGLLGKKALAADDRRGIESALVAICRRRGGADVAAAPIVAAMSGATMPQQRSLLRVLSVLGGDKALQAVLAAADAGQADIRTAAINALADWPDAAPLEALLDIARLGKSGDAARTALALRGFGRLTGKAKGRKPGDMTQLFAKALSLAKRAETKRALLGRLGSVVSPAAMKLAVANLSDAAVVNDAGLAAVRIAKTIWRSHRAEVKSALTRVLAVCKAPAVRQQAYVILLLKLTRPDNLALGATATSPDGIDKDGAAGGDQAAIDGKPETYWDEVDNQKVYRLKVTFKAATVVSALSILGHGHHNYAPKDFDIVCDGKVVKTVKNAVYTNNRLQVRFGETRCTSLELRITGKYGPSPGIRELEIYDLDATAKGFGLVNLARDATARSPDGIEKDGAAGGDPAAIDGNSETYWDEQDDHRLYLLKIDLPRPANVSAISILGHKHHDFAPKDFRILCDNEVVKTVQGATYIDNELVVVFPSTRCKSLELAISGCYGKSPAIRELGIYHVDLPGQPKSGPSPMLDAPSYTWRWTDNSLALLNHGHAVWQLNYDKRAPTPYFHPVCLTDCTDLTCLSPPDHPWHRALWFAWKQINGLNYWEEDRKTGLSEGRTEVTSVKVDPGQDHSARIEMSLSYHPPDQPAVLTEKRLLVVSAPDKVGRYRIDWHSTFKAGQKDVLLDRTPIPGEKNGVGHGGYAGLSVRVAKSLRDWRVVDAEGRTAMECHRKGARWLDFSGMTANGKPGGIAIFDHPSNVRHPSPWFLVLNPNVPFGYFSPAVLFEKPYTLSAGKTLTLRYRILIHPGRADKAMLEAEWKKWSAP